MDAAEAEVHGKRLAADAALQEIARILKLVDPDFIAVYATTVHETAHNLRLGTAEILIQEIEQTEYEEGLHDALFG